MKQFPWMSPYVAFDNNPVLYIDPYGLSAGLGDPPVTNTPTMYMTAKKQDGGFWHGTGRFFVGVGKGLWGTVKFVGNIVNLDPDKNSLIATGKGIYQLGKSVVAGVNWVADKTGAWDEPEWSKQQRKGIRDGFNAIDWSDPEMYGEVVGSLVGGGAITKVGKLSVLGNIGKAEAAVISTADEAAVIATKSADDLAAAGATKRVPPACFIAGTKISTSSGYKNIEDIQVDDSVWAFDDTDLTTSLKPVYNTTIKTSEHLLLFHIGTDQIHTTDDHPFYVNGRWVKAQDLNVGDSLVLFSGEKVVISYKNRLDTLATVYNFAVADLHSYYVGEQQILVHNNNPCSAGQPLSTKISVQKQARHVAGTAKHGGGFLNSVEDAQTILDAVHSGEATFLGTSSAGHQVYRFNGVTGTNVNLGTGITSQPTNVFMIKGTSSPSVVPTSPTWQPE